MADRAGGGWELFKSSGWLVVLVVGFLLPYALFVLSFFPDLFVGKKNVPGRNEDPKTKAQCQWGVFVDGKFPFQPCKIAFYTHFRCSFFSHCCSAWGGVGMGKQWWIGRIAVINWVSPNVWRMDNRSELVCTYEFCSVFALFWFKAQCLNESY